MNISRLLKSALFALVIFLPCSASAQEGGANRVRVEFAFTDTIKDGHCTGGRGVCLIVSWERGSPGKIKGKKVLGELTIDGGKLRADFMTPLPKIGKEKKRTVPITIFEDVRLESKTAAALGFKSITIKRGDYAVDYKFQKYGSTIFEVNMER